jgi:hypothetical protein
MKTLRATAILVLLGLGGGCYRLLLLLPCFLDPAPKAPQGLCALSP